MTNIIPIIIAILVLIAILLLFLLTPFLKNHFTKYYCAGMFVLILILMFIPGSFLCEIKLPIINNTINGFIVDILSSTEHYRNLVSYTPNIEENILSIVAGITKMSFSLILLSLTFSITSIVLLIIHLVKKYKKTAITVFSSFMILILSSILLITPVYTILLINETLATNLTENKTLIEEYPEYKEHDKLFEYLDKGSNLLPDFDMGQFDVPLAMADFFSNGDVNGLLNDLNAINNLLKQVKESGIIVIYEDENFDFTNTVKGTFNFSKIRSLITEVLKTNVYNDIARSYTNDILKSFEHIIQAEAGKDKLDLQLSKQDFAKQYNGIIDLLEFVVKYDMIKELSNFNLFKLAKIIISNADALNTVLTLTQYPLVRKIGDYLKLDQKYDNLLFQLASPLLETVGLRYFLAAVYTCLQLYTAMNDWLDRYRQTDFYNSAYSFLAMKGVIKSEG